MALKQYSMIVGLLLCNSLLFAQYKVQFRVKQLPSYHQPKDTIYLAGSFNSWNPAHPAFALRQSGSLHGTTIELPRGSFEYKITRGSWDRSEALARGAQAPNRKIMINKDTSIDISVEQWADHFPKKPRETTAGKNVHIIDTAFFIPQLNRYRRIWIYLPASYASSRKKYPVLYLQDGQNVFDDATSFSGEWGVDETLDTLEAPYRDMIVVAVDNGADKRINEYAPYDMEKYGKGEGDAYVDFLVQTLQPFINKHYRTRRQGKFNFVAGSSMGGLISFYALLKYPQKFGAAGVFSPAFWINPPFKNLDHKMMRKVKGRIYFFAGQQESEDMVTDMLQVWDQMQKHSKARMQTVIRAEGKHSEATWRAEFPLFVKWLME